MRDLSTTHGRAITSFYVARRQCVTTHRLQNRRCRVSKQHSITRHRRRICRCWIHTTMGKGKRGNAGEYQIYNIDSMSHLGRPQNWKLCIFPFPLNIISISPPHSFLTQLYCQSCPMQVSFVHPDHTVTLYWWTKSNSKTVTERQLTDYLIEV
jgi:hypothetical protein